MSSTEEIIMAGQPNYREVLYSRIQNKAFIINNEHIIVKPPLQGTFGPHSRGAVSRLSEAMLYGFQKASTVSHHQNGSLPAERIIAEYEKVLKYHKDYWIRHPNIVDVFGITYISINDSPHICLVVEHIDQTLDDFLQSQPGRKLNFGEILQISLHVANGLRHLHTKLQLIHCALSCTNVALVNMSQAQTLLGAKIMITSRVSKEHSQWIPTSSNILLPYIPNQCPETCNQSIDMYSYGKVLEKMLEAVSDASTFIRPFVEIIQKVTPYKSDLVLELSADNAFSLLNQTEYGLHGDSDDHMVSLITLNCAFKLLLHYTSSHVLWLKVC